MVDEVNYRTDIDYRLTIRRGDEETAVEPVRFVARSIAWWVEASFPENPDGLLTFKAKDGDLFTVKESQIIEAEPRPKGKSPL